VSVNSAGTQVSQGGGHPTISADGRFVCFDSYATNLVTGDTNNRGDIFVHDRNTGFTKLISVSTAGDQGNNNTGGYGAALSSDGRYLAFMSDATNLVADDTNGNSDIFVRDTHQEGTTTRVSVDSAGNQGDGSSYDDGNNLAISTYGTYVTFISYSANLVDNDTNGTTDAFRYSNLIDTDADGVPDSEDNCPSTANYDQANADGDRAGDACETCDSDPYKYSAGSCGCGNPDTDLDSDGTPDCIDDNVTTPEVTDEDSDGILAEEEDSAPNNGDGNNDGIKDSQQDNVTSMQTHDDQYYVTLASPEGTKMESCQAPPTPSVDGAPTDVTFNYDFFEFTITGVTPGGSTTVIITTPEGYTADTYYKYGPTPDNPTAHWYEFMFDGTTGAEINGNIITLYFVDGLRGDDDLDSTNGIIVDEGGPGTIETTNAPVASSSDDDSSSCFIGSMNIQ
jgi:hypothetical protein